MWRLLVLFLGLSLALIHPGAVPDAYAADKDTGSIVGVVVVESGGGSKPVANADIRLTFGSKSDTRKTGPDGKYAFPDLLPGKYTIKVNAPDGLKSKGDGTATVTVTGGDVERGDF